MLIRVRRRRRALTVVASTILAALLSNAALVAWYHSFPWHNDQAFVERIKPLKRRLRPAEAEHSQFVLMIGSSRTMFGFHAGVIEKSLMDNVKAPFIAHNFGMVGAGPAYQYVITRRLLEAGIRPQLLLLEISPCFMNGAKSTILESHWIDSNRLLWREEDELARHGWLPAPRTTWDRITPAWWQFRELLTKKSANGKPLKTPQPNVPIDAWGCSALTARSYDADARRVILDTSRDTFKPFLDNWTPEGPAVNVLRMTLDLCRRERIPVILVMLPEGPVAQTWYSADSKKRVTDFLDRFPASEGCPLVDAWNWLAEDDFVDSHHPHEDGAKKFSARLVRECLIPWFQSGSDGHLPHGPFLMTSSPRLPAKAND